MSTLLHRWRVWGLIAICAISLVWGALLLARIDQLTPIEQEVHAVFTHRLLQAHPRDDKKPWRLCTFIFSDKKPIPVSTALLEALKHSTPAELNFEFLDGATCNISDAGPLISEDGPRVSRFFGYRRYIAATNEVIWDVGSNSGPTSGGGETYRLTGKDGAWSIESLAAWIN